MLFSERSQKWLRSSAERFERVADGLWSATMVRMWVISEILSGCVAESLIELLSLTLPRAETRPLNVLHPALHAAFHLVIPAY